MKAATRKKIGIGALIAGVIGAIVAGVRHLAKKPEPELVCDGYDLYRCADETCELIEVNSPTCGWVPTEEFGRYQGVVYDSATGEAIPAAAILVDGELDTYSELNGNYRTGELTVGPHTFTVRSGMYETLVVDIEVEPGLHLKDFAMQKKPPPEDFTIDWVRINDLLDHITVALGESLLVQAQIKSPTAVSPVCCYFNGVPVCRDVEYTTGGTAWPSFTYTPDAAGDLIVQFGNWTAIVTVLADELGEWYSPWGCVQLDQGCWLSRNALIESLAWRPSLLHPHRDYRDCVFRINIYGGYGRINVRCPYCSAILRATSPDYVALFNDVLNHIEQEHPHLPLNKPPAWLRVGGSWSETKAGQVIINGEPTRRGVAAIPPGDASVEVRWWEGTKEFTVHIMDWGDRVYLDADTGEVTTTTTWDELLYGYG